MDSLVADMKALMSSLLEKIVATIKMRSRFKNNVDKIFGNVYRYLLANGGAGGADGTDGGIIVCGSPSILM